MYVVLVIVDEGDGRGREFNIEVRVNTNPFWDIFLETSF